MKRRRIKPLLGAEIGSRLKAMGWSNGELARRTRINKATIGRIISGKTISPKYQYILRIAEAITLDLPYLMDDREAAR